jgi:hypothetical protein
MRSISPLIAAAVLAIALPLSGCLAAPKDVKCSSDRDGNHVSWGPVENATYYDVFRFLPNVTADIANATLVGTTNDTWFVDTNVTSGVTYRYSIVAGSNQTLSEPSELCSVTSIPFFPSFGAGALAMAGGLGAVGAVLYARRKR